MAISVRTAVRLEHVPAAFALLPPLSGALPAAESQATFQSVGAPERMEGLSCRGPSRQAASSRRRSMMRWRPASRRATCAAASGW